ncbi:MAG: hypothetical protein JHC93_01800 [Parachlamydiales bacterium]|nr:hypothetical protein [Parachlamydiales bacterium]
MEFNFNISKQVQTELSQYSLSTKNLNVVKRCIGGYSDFNGVVDAVKKITYRFFQFIKRYPDWNLTSIILKSAPKTSSFEQDEYATIETKNCTDFTYGNEVSKFVPDVEIKALLNTLIKMNSQTTKSPCTRKVTPLKEKTS